MTRLLSKLGKDKFVIEGVRKNFKSPSEARKYASGHMIKLEL